MLALSNRFSGFIALALAAVAAGAVTSCCAEEGAEEAHTFFVQSNLVSDIPGRAAHTDPLLSNPWGLAFGPQTPFWVANNGTGTSTVYDGDGQRQPAQNPLIVAIPAVSGGRSTPTGIAFNGADAFLIAGSGGVEPSRFLFATEEGTIAGWNPGVEPRDAVIAVDYSALQAVYKGLAIGSESGESLLYATNFYAGRVDVFDTDFIQVDLGPNAFMDPTIPVGYAPFGIENISGTVYVTYALQDAARADDVPGQGHGYVNAFGADGRLLRRVVSGGTLNSPWGLAIAPDGFGDLSGLLLVGNFGDGRIHAYNRETGARWGALVREDGQAIAIEGLWAIKAGNGGSAGDSDEIYFTAGIEDEAHGLFGSLRSEMR